MMRKRIAIPFTGERVGGSHISSLLLLEGLDRTIFEPVVLVHREGPVAELLRKRSIPFTIEPLNATKSWEGSAFRRLFASFAAIFPVIRLIRKHRLDLVHVQDHKAFQLWVFATFLLRRPMVLHWRGPYRKTLITRVMMKLATRILVISDYLKNKLPDEIQRRSTLIYNPFDTHEPLLDHAEARTALRAELGLPPEAILLAWIGNCDRRKRPGQFVDIVAALREKRSSPPIKGILFGGPGDLSDDPAWIAKRDAARGYVLDLGFRDPITPSLAGCDALVVTAVEEPFGRTIVEAMLSGVPVVAARDGGYVDVLDDGKTGFLVSPGEIHDFVRALDLVLDNSAVIEGVVAQAREVAMDRFSIDRHARSVMAVYDALLGKSTPNRQLVAEQQAE